MIVARVYGRAIYLSFFVLYKRMFKENFVKIFSAVLETSD